MNYTDLVAACRKGDNKAQHALYDEFAPMAMGVCMRFASCADEAEDLMQDGFVRVFEQLNRLREPEKVGAWIYRLMLNVCLRHYRKQRLRPELSLDTTEVPLPPPDPFTVQEVVQALQMLSPQQRTVFNLLEVEGFSVAEAAAQLRCSEVNIRSMLCRAKERLRNILTEQ